MKRKRIFSKMTACFLTVAMLLTTLNASPVYAGELPQQTVQQSVQTTSSEGTTQDPQTKGIPDDTTSSSVSSSQLTKQTVQSTSSGGTTQDPQTKETPDDATSSNVNSIALTRQAVQKSVQAMPKETDEDPQTDEAANDATNSYVGSTNLNDFVISADILKNGESTTELNYGDTYTVHLAFSEREGTGGQINFNETMTYTLPEGLELVKANERITITAYVPEQVQVHFQTGMDQDGNVTVTPESGQETNLELLAQAANASFEVYVDAKWTGGEGQGTIDFGQNVKKEIIGRPAKSDLKISKKASYKKEKGVVEYTLTVTSTGNNTNVILEDTISGDAVTLDPSTIKVSSNKGATTATMTPDPNNLNHLTSNAFNMQDGEKITVSYEAKVDYTKLSGNIIDKDDTRNTLSAKSDENKPNPVEASVDHKTAFDYATKKGEKFDQNAVSADGRNYILYWTIEVNPDYKNIGDITLTDTLQNTDIQKYDPSSFNVTAVTEDGQAVSGVNITSPAGTATSWTQKLPSTQMVNGNQVPVKYTITYRTLVDKATVDNSWAKIQVKNDVTVGNTKTEGKIDIPVPEGNTYEASKKYTTANKENQTVEWQITVRAPEKGFDSFTITDTLPNMWESNQFYYNELKEDTLVVKVGDKTLQKGTDYTLAYTEPTQSSGGRFTITFQTGEGGKGLAAAAQGSGEQTVTVTYTTDYAKTGWPTNQKMTNSASISANGINKTVTAEYNPGTKAVEKTANGSFSGDNLNKKVTYTIAVTGVTQDDLDASGNLTVTDTFNPQYLKIDSTSGKVTGTNEASNQKGSKGNDKGTYTATAGNDGTVTFTFEPARDSDGHLYSRYYFSYSMSIKDVDALKALITAAAQENTDQISEWLKNTASWGTFSDTYTATFESNPLTKDIIEEPGMANNQTITWRLTANEEGAQLNGGKPMDLVDDFTVQNDNEYEMNYVEGSAKVYYNDVLQENVQLKDQQKGEQGGYILTWEVPDATKVVIEYQTQIVGDTTGKTKFQNRATLNGQSISASEGKDYTIDASGSGTASTMNFTIRKTDVNDLRKGLQGAEFELYADDGNGNPTPLEVNGEDVIPTFVTGEDGTATVTSHQQQNGWALWNHRIYYLREVKAPDGYDIPEGGLWIKIWTDVPGSEVNPNLGEEAKPDDATVVNNNTTIDVTNGQLTIPVSKQLVRGEWEDGDAFSIQITADPNIDPSAGDVESPPLPTRNTITFTQDGTDQFVLSGFTEPNKNYKYLIQEVQETKEGITNSKAVYSLVVHTELAEGAGGERYMKVTHTLTKITDDYGNAVSAGAVESADFVNTRGDIGNLSLTKRVSGTTTNQTFTFKVTLSDTTINGTYGDMTFENGVATVRLKKGETKIAGGLPAGITYKVEEQNTPSNYRVTYRNATGTIEKDQTAAVIATNTYQGGGGGGTSSDTQLPLNGTKTITGRNFQAGDKFTFTVTAAEGTPMPEKTSVTIEPASGTTAAVDFGKIKYTKADIGKTYTYTITEQAGSIEGITYDTVARIVTVTVRDAGNGRPAATVTYQKGDESVSGLQWTNAYGTGTQLSLNGTKTITGRDFQAGDKFTFHVTAAEGTPMPEKTSVTIEPTSGTTAAVDFGKIAYTKADAGKTYTYTITEQAGSIEGITYDTVARTVTVTVREDENGKLTAAATYQKGNESVSGLQWTNAYEAKATSITLSAKKLLQGRDLKNGEFTFLLKDEQGKTVSSAVNDKTGLIQFAGLSFTKAGTYTYTLSEQQGNAAGVTYDKTVYKIIVTVTDDLKGNLTASVDTQGKQLTFTNQYSEESEKPESNPSSEDKKTPEGGQTPERENGKPESGKKTTSETTSSSDATGTLNSPQTGDNTDLFTPGLAMFVAGIVAAVVIFQKKKRG